MGKGITYTTEFIQEMLSTIIEKRKELIRIRTEENLKLSIQENKKIKLPHSEEEIKLSNKIRSFKQILKRRNAVRNNDEKI